jgi:IclR family KDG regulon transcriptional repressor
MYNAPVLKKAVEVLKFIVKNGNPLGVTEISKQLSISKSTVFGILKAFEEEKFIVKDKATKKYVIGQELFELSKNVFKGGEFTTIARPFLEKLVGLVDETVLLCAREDNVVKVLDAIETKKTFKISCPVGASFPITASVLCKAFLSPMNNEKIKNFLKERGLPKYTEKSITDIDLFLEEVEKTRTLGYSLDLEEYLTGIRAVATLVYTDDTPAGAVCAVGFSRSMSDDKLPYVIRHLKNAAQQISERLSQFNLKQ